MSSNEFLFEDSGFCYSGSADWNSPTSELRFTLTRSKNGSRVCCLWSCLSKTLLFYCGALSVVGLRNADQRRILFCKKINWHSSVLLRVIANICHRETLSIANKYNVHCLEASVGRVRRWVWEAFADGINRIIQFLKFCILCSFSTFTIACMCFYCICCYCVIINIYYSCTALVGVALEQSHTNFILNLELDLN